MTGGAARQKRDFLPKNRSKVTFSMFFSSFYPADSRPLAEEPMAPPLRGVGAPTLVLCCDAAALRLPSATGVFSGAGAARGVTEPPKLPQPQPLAATAVAAQRQPPPSLYHIPGERPSISEIAEAAATAATSGSGSPPHVSAAAVAGGTSPTTRTLAAAFRAFWERDPALRRPPARPWTPPEPGRGTGGIQYG